MTRYLLVLLATLLLVPAVAATGEVPTPVPAELAGLELPDQFGGRDSLMAHQGSALVAVVVNVRRLALIETWERDLSLRIPGIRFLNVADLPSAGVVDLERTAATLRRRVPAEVPVLMDVERHWATLLELDTELPNLLVFDAGTRLVARFRGRWSEALARDVVAAIESLPAPTAALP